jgi:hypothetical protein
MLKLGVILPIYGKYVLRCRRRLDWPFRCLLTFYYFFSICCTLQVHQTPMSTIRLHSRAEHSASHAYLESTRTVVRRHRLSRARSTSPPFLTNSQHPMPFSASVRLALSFVASQTIDEETVVKQKELHSLSLLFTNYSI